MCNDPAMVTAPHRVVVLALEHVVAFELGLPHAFLGGAQGLDGTPLYEVGTATVDGGPVTTSAGYRVLPDGDLSLLAGADTVVVPGVAGGAVLRTAELPDGVAQALQGPARLVSICTGAFELAAASRLEGRPATTHWLHAERFARLHPQVRLDPDVLYVDDGDVLTSAGNAAGIDLLLHVVRRDHGSATATRIARRRVVAPWRDGGQSQFVDRPVPDPDGTGTAATRAWVQQHLDRPWTLEQLAAHAGTSVRTFTRRFREETGLSPLRWLTRQRVELARHLLETTDAGVDRVAEQSGFGTATSLRQHLHAAIGVAPQAYRRTFRGVPPAVLPG